MADQNILVDLDTILDTRLGALSLVSGEAAGAVLETDYWNRPNDDFEQQIPGKVTNAQYLEIYNNRNFDVLRNSLLTNMVHILGEMTRTLQTRQIRQLDVGRITLTLNVWPYELEPHEYEVFAEAIRPYVALNTHVDVVNLPLDRATPSLLLSEYAAWITYDLDAWLLKHGEALRTNPIPEFTLITPKIFFTRRLPTEEELRESETNVFDPFKVVELGLLEWVAIEFREVGFFSLIEIKS